MILIVAFLVTLTHPALAQDDSSGSLGDLLNSIPEIEAPKSEAMIKAEEEANKAPDITFPDYTHEVRAEIMANWQVKPKVVKKNPKAAAQVMIKVADDGRILEVVVVQASGDHKFDKSVFAAIETTGRVQAPPPAYAGDAERGIVISFVGREALAK